MRPRLFFRKSLPPGPRPSVSRHLSFATCHLSPVLCHLSPAATCHLSPGIRHLSSVIGCWSAVRWARCDASSKVLSGVLAPPARCPRSAAPHRPPAPCHIPPAISHQSSVICQLASAVGRPHLRSAPPMKRSLPLTTDLETSSTSYGPRKGRRDPPKDPETLLRLPRRPAGTR